MSLFSQTLVNQLSRFGQAAVRAAAQPAGPILPRVGAGGGARRGGGKPGAPACTPCAAAAMVRDARKKFGR